jgi:hypothetical protein
MANVTADQVVNHNIYAKDYVDGYTSTTLQNVRYKFYPKQLIGNIYSYIEEGGQLYWIVYVKPEDFANNKATILLHETGKFDVPDLPEIIQKIETQQKNAAIEKSGAVAYYVEKYIPYIVGAIVVAVALPSIVKSFKK